MPELTQPQKLEALVRRATESGWYRDEKLMRFLEEARLNEYNVLETDNEHQVHVFAIIYQHDFARALFGEHGPCSFYVPAHEPYDEPDNIEYFQYRLQQAVISKDPIDYMYKAVFGGDDAI